LSVGNNDDYDDNQPQPDSKFAAAYHKGLHKKEYWKVVLEDILDVWAKLPEVSPEEE